MKLSGKFKSGVCETVSCPVPAHTLREMLVNESPFPGADLLAQQDLLALSPIPIPWACWTLVHLIRACYFPEFSFSLPDSSGSLKE